MMRYTMTFPEEQHEALMGYLFEDSSVEQAAYLLCGLSQTGEETRFLVRKVVPVDKDVLQEQTRTSLSIPSSSFVPVLQEASEGKECFFMVHSHPTGYEHFSTKDDEEEPKLIRSAYARIDGGIHGSLIFSNQNKISARIWLQHGEELIHKPVSMIRVVGQRYKFIQPINAPYLENALPEQFFDRQVRAFGRDLQNLLGNLHVGVVGCGGTGSAVIEQLARLGVGKITVVDDDEVEDTNISRIHHSGIGEVGRLKVQVMENMVRQIGFGAGIRAIARKVIYESTARELRNCDLLFGCTDDHAGRAVLNELSIHYCIPFIDMAVLVDSRSGILSSVLGRITVVRPKVGCLNCRGRVKPEMVAAELMAPELRAQRIRDGYAPELQEKDPAVVTFTTAVASQAVMEALHLLTGFMGDDRDVGELLCRFDSTAFSVRPNPSVLKECSCSNLRTLGRGDRRNFMGMLWPAEPSLKES